MATDGRRQGTPVERALFESGHLFEFAQALKLLETMFPDRTCVGEGVDHAREVARLRSSIRFDFPSADVEEIRKPETGGAPVEMTVNLMGLAGEFGPLPAWVGELAIERAWRQNPALRDFLDLFNHRLLSMLHRAKKRAHPALDPRSPDKGRVAATLFAFIGLGTPHLRGAMGISERAILPFAGLLAARPRTAVGLERLLSGYFNVPVRLEQFVGQWETIEESDVTRIGVTGQNQRLGESTVLGRRVFDIESKVELHVGPVTLQQFHDFLPNRTCARAIAALYRFYTGDAIGFTYRLILKAAEVPELRLGVKGKPRLGLTTWLRTRPPDRDASQVRLEGRA